MISKFTEWDGIKLGDRVKLIGVQMPEGGRVGRVFLDKAMGKGREEMAYDVICGNERWYPIYRNELELVK